MRRPPATTPVSPPPSRPPSPSSWRSGGPTPRQGRPSRSRSPSPFRSLAAATGVAAAILGWFAAADDLAPNGLFVPPLLAVFHLGAHRERRRALQGTLLIAALAIATPAVAGTGVGEALFVTVLLGAP